MTWQHIQGSVHIFIGLKYSINTINVYLCMIVIKFKISCFCIETARNIVTVITYVIRSFGTNVTYDNFLFS